MFIKNKKSKNEPNFHPFVAIDIIKVGDDVTGADHRQSRYVTDDEFGLRWQNGVATPLFRVRVYHRMPLSLESAVAAALCRRSPKRFYQPRDISRHPAFAGLCLSRRSIAKADGQKHPNFPRTNPIHNRS